MANRTDREIYFLATRRDSNEKPGHSSTISEQFVVVNANRRTKIVNSSYSTFQDGRFTNLYLYYGMSPQNRVISVSLALTGTTACCQVRLPANPSSPLCVTGSVGKNTSAYLRWKLTTRNYVTFCCLACSGDQGIFDKQAYNSRPPWKHHM